MNTRSLPFTIYPQKRKMLGLLFVCVAFVIGGVWMISDGKWIGWVSTGIFGLGILVFLIRMHPSASFLRISEEGIEFCELFRSYRIPWSAISEFGTYSIRHHGIRTGKHVGFNYSAEYKESSNLRAFNKNLTDFEAGLDTYGFNAEELAEMLNQYHRCFILKMRA